MLEVEAKARLASADAARARLRAMGAALQGMEEQRDTYFAHPDPARDFAARDEALRLREAGGRAELTYKGPKLDAATKTREELTVLVGSARDVARVLERVGFREAAVVRKRRETWSWQGLDVCLDEVEGLGWFVEVEAHADPSGLEATRGRVLALLAQLGEGPSIRASYLELLQKDRKS
jgi:adenylate cyclase class 2